MNEHRVEIYRIACALLEDQGCEAVVREDYSGRGMYDSTCPGIVTEASGTEVGAAIVIAVLRAAEDLGIEAEMEYMVFVPRRVDNMGLQYIYY